jgi:hypothetical protein
MGFLFENILLVLYDFFQSTLFYLYSRISLFWLLLYFIFSLATFIIQILNNFYNFSLRLIFLIVFRYLGRCFITAILNIFCGTLFFNFFIFFLLNINQAFFLYFCNFPTNYLQNILIILNIL